MKNLLKFEKLYIEAWGGELFLRSLSENEREEWEKHTVEYLEVPDGKGGFRLGMQLKRDLNRVRFVALCAIDPETGERMFSSEEDIIALAGKSAAALDLVYEKCLEINGLSKKEVEALTNDGVSASTLPHNN